MHSLAKSRHPVFRRILAAALSVVLFSAPGPRPALAAPISSTMLRPERVSAQKIAAGLEETPQPADLTAYDLPPEDQAPSFLSAKQAILSSQVERWLSNRVGPPQLMHLKATLTLTVRAPAKIPDYAVAETRFTAAVAAWQRARTLIHQQRNTLRGQYRMRRSRMPPADRQAFLDAVRYIAKALRRAEMGLVYAQARAPQSAATVFEAAAPAEELIDLTVRPARPMIPALDAQRPGFVNQSSGLWGWLQTVPPEKSPGAVNEIRTVLRQLIEGVPLDTLRVQRQVAQAYANGGDPSGAMLGWQWVTERLANEAAPHSTSNPPPSYTRPTHSQLAAQIWQTEFTDSPPTPPAEIPLALTEPTPAAAGLEEWEEALRSGPVIVEVSAQGATEFWSASATGGQWVPIARDVVTTGQPAALAEHLFQPGARTIRFRAEDISRPTTPLAPIRVYDIRSRSTPDVDFHDRAITYFGGYRGAEFRERPTWGAGAADIVLAELGGSVVERLKHWFRILGAPRPRLVELPNNLVVLDATMLARLLWVAEQPGYTKDLRVRWFGSDADSGAFYITTAA